MHKKEERPFAAFVWADRKHDICLWVSDKEKREAAVLEHSPHAIQTWEEELRERFGGAPVAVAIELAQGPIGSRGISGDAATAQVDASAGAPDRDCGSTRKMRKSWKFCGRQTERTVQMLAIHQSPDSGPCATSQPPSARRCSSGCRCMLHVSGD